jgi:Rx N-terminal domain
MSYLTLILEKIIEAIVSLVVGIFPSLIANLPTEASARAELVKLRDRANRIHARLHDAEQNRQIESKPVLLWLSELRSIAFDTEDLNEEFEARGRIAARASHWSMLTSAWYYFCVLSRIDEINKRYDAIYRDRQAQMLLQCDQARAVTRNRRCDTRQSGSSEGELFSFFSIGNKSLFLFPVANVVC